MTLRDAFRALFPFWRQERPRPARDEPRTADQALHAASLLER